MEDGPGGSWGGADKTKVILYERLVRLTGLKDILGYR